MKERTRVYDRPTARDLKALFQDLNERHFKSRLRPVRVVVMSPRWKGWHGEHGFYDSKRRTIRLARSAVEHSDSWDNGGLRGLLLHEMCHIGTRGASHGKHFLSKLNRLARSKDQWVADWAAKEAVLYREGQPWISIMGGYRDWMDEWAGSHPRPAFGDVIRRIAKDLPSTEAHVRHLWGKWLKREWQRAVARSIEFEGLRSDPSRLKALRDGGRWSTQRARPGISVERLGHD